MKERGANIERTDNTEQIADASRPETDKQILVKDILT